MWVLAAVRCWVAGSMWVMLQAMMASGEQGESFALDVLAVGVSAAELSLVRRRTAASLISAISCSTDVATSRGYALEPFGALSLQTLRIAITTAAVVPSTKTLTPLLPTPQHLPVVRIRRDAPTRSPRRRPPCCRTTRNRYISSTYSVNPKRACHTRRLRHNPNDHLLERSVYGRSQLRWRLRRRWVIAARGRASFGYGYVRGPDRVCGRGMT